MNIHQENEKRRFQERLDCQYLSSIVDDRIRELEKDPLNPPPHIQKAVRQFSKMNKDNREKVIKILHDFKKLTPAGQRKLRSMFATGEQKEKQKIQ